ncbi:MAG: hypothetical protein D6788_08705 [Planctomycetota bacterium]|nr:MAG: hypothetical protein D6788_08705 [Planctomycetota bacterium]
MGVLLLQTLLLAQIPDHPIITEVYTDPPGTNDAPVGRDPSNLHQEYIELYLPPAANLDPALNKDALRLTFYEVEGDTSSSGNTLVNYRFDLPTFDLDASNGITPGALPRPASGVVVLGWVDYVGDPPTDLAGTPSTRIGLINGGIVTAPPDFTFIAINGHHFTGTTNFPLLVAENLIDLPNEARSGVIQNGSAAYLLVNRDDPGYVELCDDKHAVDCAAGADPNLPNDSVGLRTSALLDGYAGNDDSQFDVTAQPLPSGGGIDLDLVLPAGGAFSLLIPQIPETISTGLNPGIANGYARRFVDVPKTTENGNPFDDDPVQDALNAYRHIRNDGPFFPTPGRVVLTNTPPELGLGASAIKIVDILAGTTAPMRVIAANVGGNFPIDVTATPGPSSDPTIATFGSGDPALGVLGQEAAFPTLTVTVPTTAPDGATAQADVTVSASNSTMGDPPVVAPTQMTTVTATVLNPTTGRDANGLPFQATVFLAIQPIPAQAGVLNEFAQTEFAAHVQAHLGTIVQDTEGKTPTLLDPTTNINDGLLMDALIKDYPDPGAFINFPAPPGGLDLFQTVVQSAIIQSGSTTYDASLDFNTGTVKAVRFNVPDTFTFGGSFTPSDPVYFADATGRLGDSASPLSNVVTSRDFEIAILETNVRLNSTIESGATDDFGLLIEVQSVEPGSPLVVGEFVFLSFTGGLQGEDIDTVAVGPGPNVANLIYLDLDNLHDVLGIRSIEQIIFIDGGGSSTLDPVEAYSLNPICFAVEGVCNDGIDNDCDTLTDCADPDCAGDPACGGCGNGICDTGEDQCNCPADCGTPPALETGSCNDGIDNDCDMLTDCADPDCSSDPVCAVCGNGLCEPGEDQCNCPADCGTPPANESAFCNDGIDNDCDGLLDCLDSDCPPCPCAAPVVEGAGPRYLNVTPDPMAPQVALFVTGVSPDVTCVSGYVQADGTIGPNPLYRSPGAWSTVHVRDVGILSDRTYAVRADCNPAAPGTVLSPPVEGTLWAWADTDNSGGPLIDIVDAVHILDGFRGTTHTIPCTSDIDCAPVAPFFHCDMAVGKCLWNTTENIDLKSADSCLPDRIIDVTVDVLSAIDAFRGAPPPCMSPCP